MRYQPDSTDTKGCGYVDLFGVKELVDSTQTYPMTTSGGEQRDHS